MYSSSVSSACSPEFRDPQPSFVSWYAREYPSYLDSLRFVAMQESGVQLTICDRNNIDAVTFFGSWVKQWLDCGGCSMSVTFSFSIGVNMPFGPGYEEFDHWYAVWDLAPSYSGCDILEVCLSLVLLCCPFDLFYRIGLLDYWWCDCGIECLLRTYQRALFVDWHGVKILCIPPRVSSCSFSQGAFLVTPFRGSSSVVRCYSSRPFILIPVYPQLSCWGTACLAECHVGAFRLYFHSFSMFGSW